jgi:hypothetical protein
MEGSELDAVALASVGTWSPADVAGLARRCELEATEHEASRREQQRRAAYLWGMLAYVDPDMIQDRTPQQRSREAGFFDRVTAHVEEHGCSIEEALQAVPISTPRKPKALGTPAPRNECEVPGVKAPGGPVTEHVTALLELLADWEPSPEPGKAARQARALERLVALAQAAHRRAVRASR